MKKNFALMLTLLFAGSTLFYTGCKKDEDEVPPTINVLGPNPDYVQKGQPYVDQGATASDDVDGTISVTTTGQNFNTSDPAVTPSTPKTFTVSYSAKDEEGNTASASRTVHLVDFTNRTYTALDTIKSGPGSGPLTYTVTTNLASSANKRILLTNFNGLGTSVVIYVDFNGGTLTIPPQDVIGSPGNEGDIYGSGKMTGNNAQSMVLDYTLDYDAAGVANSTGTAHLILQ